MTWLSIAKTEVILAVREIADRSQLGLKWTLPHVSPAAEHGAGNALSAFKLHNSKSRHAACDPIADVAVAGQPLAHRHTAGTA